MAFTSFAPAPVSGFKLQDFNPLTVILCDNAMELWLPVSGILLLVLLLMILDAFSFDRNRWRALMRVGIV